MLDRPFNSGFDIDLPCVDVAIVELTVEVEEDVVIVDIRSHFLCLRPGRGLEILIRQLGEHVLVEVVDLVDVALLDHVLEVLEELLDLVRNSVVILDWVSGVSIARVLIFIEFVVRIHGSGFSRRLFSGKENNTQV